MNSNKAYLYGLICGRGHIVTVGKRIVIEFAHKNPTIPGIAHCPKCGWIATKRKVNNPNGDLFCKNKDCQNLVDKSVKAEYEQKESTINSIHNHIIPFLKEVFCSSTYIVTGNDHISSLLIDMSEDNILYDEIIKDFKQERSHHTFEIPHSIYNADQNYKIEFINGLLDTAGYFNAGSWEMVSGQNGIGRMRIYLQIIRNWMLPVQICNFLKTEFKLPIQTIRWGHPNMVDGNVEKYFQGNELFWTKEHQIKFYPEFYEIFSCRLEHKQKMFEELIKHNILTKFKNISDCSPPKKVLAHKIKAYHPEEKNKRLPINVRAHFNSYCQLCHDLGCTYSNEAINDSKNPKLFYLTGKDDDTNLNEAKIKQHRKSKKLFIEAANNNKNAIIKDRRLKKHLPDEKEKDLYLPLVKWYTNYLSKKGYKNSLVHDTSAYFLDQFVAQNNLYESYSNCANYKIKPDIVGFLGNKKLAFMEVKIDDITLIDLGQLLGYCLVAIPEQAILVSKKEPSPSLQRLLSIYPNILNYTKNQKIEIAIWNDSHCNFLDYQAKYE